MKTVIAEKPSVAKDIAHILGANQRGNGYLNGNGYYVTWAFGHLVGLALPDSYGFKGFERAHLPMIPKEFKLCVRQIKAGKEFKDDPGVVQQLKVLKELFNKSEEIIVATDAGREGELIFRYIYNYLHCKVPFRRLWISSLTDKASQNGFANLKPGNQFHNLYLSAKARSEADWLVGLNASQALSIAGQGVYSLGRVQTPTLKMICERYLEHKNFVPQKYWQIEVQTGKDNISFKAFCQEKFPAQEQAQAILSSVQQAGKLLVTDVEKSEVNENPPLLFDLTALQKEANVRLNFSAEKTLSIAQSLYEKKVMSYPRTGSRYISEDIFEEIPLRIKLLENHPKFSASARNLEGKKLNHHSVNDQKVTDHHALLITENIPEELSEEEQTIYDLVASRLLEAFSEKCVKESTSILMEAAQVPFIAKGTVIKIPGWRNILHDQEAGDETSILPHVTKGDILTIHQSECIEKLTQPKPLHTEASLLSAMENSGKELNDEDLKSAIKECGIGTPATRAGIIETLLKREYIKREKKTLVPCEKGLAVYSIVKNMKISNVEMTAQWENALAKIEQGEIATEEFTQAIEQYTRQITEELLHIKMAPVPTTRSSQHPTCECPKCQGKVVLYEKIAKCTNEECGFIIFREKSGHRLSDKSILQLITKGKTDLIKGFITQSGKKMNPVALVLDKTNWKVNFDFSDKKKQ